MRTSITKIETLTLNFPMTDQDVIHAVDECNTLRSEEGSLDRKKKLIAQEIKKVQTKVTDRLENILNREEPREVECEINFDYAQKTVDTIFKGEIMESRRMSDWEYSTRPEDVYPTLKKDTVESNDKVIPTQIEEALDRAEEISKKESNIQTPSANVNAYSEAKKETILDGLNA